MCREIEPEKPCERTGIRTCLEPNCSRRIHYDAPLDGTTVAVPLYCDKHRSTVGRHSRSVFVSSTGSSDHQMTLVDNTGKEKKAKRDYP